MSTTFFYCKYFFRDCYIFPIFQSVIFLLLIFALYKNHTIKNTGPNVKRGDLSWSYFHIFYGLMNVVLLQIINTTESLAGYKTIITIINVSILLYLCYYNRWVRNKIVGFFNKSKEMED